MILRYLQLIGMPVYELRSQTRVGQINDLLIQEDFSINSFVLKRPIFDFGAARIIASVDTIELLKEGLLVRDTGAVIELSESIRAKKLADTKNFGIGQRVLTESGQFIGTVNDYQIESKNLLIKKFHVRKIFSEMIISPADILKFENRIITVKDPLHASKVKEILRNPAIS